MRARSLGLTHSKPPLQRAAARPRDLARQACRPNGWRALGIVLASEDPGTGRTRFAPILDSEAFMPARELPGCRKRTQSTGIS